MLYRLLKKYKVELFVVFVYILAMGINIYNYVKANVFAPFFPVKGLNAFSFWEYVRIYNIGEIILFLSPIFIMILSINHFHNELTSGIFQDIVLRKGYYKYVLNNVIKSYLKCIFIIPIISIIVFFLGFIWFQDNISLVRDSLPLDLVNFPYTYLFLTLLLNVLYAIIIVNIVLCFQTKKKNFVALIINSFLFLMAINYGIYFILYIISRITGNIILLEVAEAIGIYQGYFPDTNIVITFISLILWTIISSIVVYNIYKKRQRIYDIYE